MNVFILLLSLSLTSIGFGNCGRILGLAVQFSSHISEVVGIAENLDKYGHEKYLALSSRYPNTEDFEKKGYKILRYHIPEHEMIMSSVEGEKILTDVVFVSKKELEAERQYALPAWHRNCEYMMKDKKFINTVKSLNISLVVVDGFVFMKCNIILPAHLNIPFVLVSSTFLPVHAKVPGPPSFVPAVLTEYSHKMSFTERVYNLFGSFLLLYPPFKETSNTSLLEQYAPEYKSWQEVSSKALLMFQTRNYILEWPSPIMPHFIMLPGLGSFPNSSSLNPEYTSLMKSNTEGVIIMTFGSMFAQLPDQIVEKFLAAFERIDQTVIWRLRLKSSHSFKIPENVIIKTWVPQAELLAHSNTKLFITHCGNGGQYEAVYNGVPMLGFPLFAEQPHNAHRIVDHGIGLKMDIHKFTSDELLTNINRLLNEPSFRINAQKMSAILRDRPMTSQEEAAYWINHVMKFGGDHLRSHALDMPWWQILMLDVLLVIFISIITFTCSLFFLLRFLKTLCCKITKDKLH